MTRILLGVTGGIAAYKSAELVRLLVKSGFEVKVIMTPAAQQFITPLTLQALSGNPVHTDLLDEQAEAAMGHIELARWADLFLIAPASADVLARITVGMANDLLTAVVLATSAPIAVAPAMNQAMWRNTATQGNIEILRARSVAIWGPDSGEQACGELGPGRMLEPANILAHVLDSVRHSQTLLGKRVLITAGPTREPIDPVRFLSNHSSGKMGYALAVAARDAGADVFLVTGPTALAVPSGIQAYAVSSAEEMLEQCLALATDVDLFIASAAVADYRAAEVAQQKLKKQPGEEAWSLNLVRNPDILAEVARLSCASYTVGFAAETQNLLDNAHAKLVNKKVDMIIANDVARDGVGFGSDDNAVTVITADDKREFTQQNKSLLAKKLIEYIASQMESAAHLHSPRSAE